MIGHGSFFVGLVFVMFVLLESLSPRGHAYLHISCLREERMLDAAIYWLESHVLYCISLLLVSL